MNDPSDQLRVELESAQRTVAELRAQLKAQQDGRQPTPPERENTLKEIEQAHQQWMTALDAIENPIFLHDKEFRILRANRAYQQRAGIPYQELIGRPYYEIFPKLDGPLPGCMHAMVNGEWAVDEFVQGDTIYSGRSSPVYGERGEYLLSVHSLEDVTQRKQVEKKLRESEAFTKSVLDNLPIGIAVNSVSPAVAFNYMNDNFARIYRVSPEKLADPDAFWEAVYEDAKYREQIRSRVLSDCASGEADRMHWEDVPLTRHGEETTYISASNIPLPDKQLMISMVWDVTERKRAELALLSTNNLLQSVIENAPVRIFWKDSELRYLGCNTAFAHDAGLEKPEELIGKDDYQMSWREQADLYRADDSRVMESDTPKLGFEEPQSTPDGRVIWLRTSKVPMHDVSGKVNAVLGLYDDITAWKHSELNLRESEQRFRSLFETMLNGFAYCRMLYENGQPIDFIYLDVNAAFEQQTGLKDVVGKRVSEVIPGIRQADPQLFERYGRVAAGGAPEQFEIYVEALKMWFFISVYSPQPQHFVAVFDVITERKQAEEALKNEALRRRILMGASRDGIAVINQQHQVVEANARFAKMLGYTVGEVIGLHTWDFEAAMSEAEVRAKFADLSTANATIETRHRRKDGSVFDVEVSISGTLVGGEPMVFTVSRDITGRKQQELAMQRANRALLTISAGNQTLIHAEDEQQMLNEMCDVAVHVGGYRTAWIGYAHDDATKSIEQMAQAGAGQGCPDLSPLSWDESKPESCPAARAIIGGETRVVSDILSDPSAVSWRERAIQYGYASCIALPLLDGKRAFGALVLFDDKVNIFDADEVSLLEEMAGDLAFGILTLRVKKSHSEHEQRLQLNMLQTVKAIAGIVEMRDPYTSGHQARVAELARAIARRMALPEDQVQAIHLAGLLHDLGKISIPAEILSKPGRLSEVEYSLIKMHPQSGYDILKGIDFSWPIEQMVLQHHERMDGSGYPQGLKGEQILLGARILSVADVVEAMSSHRPYRPGLGVSAALEEITRTRGTFYDGQVVDACVALFKEQNYVIPQ